MHYNTIYLAIFTAVAVSASSILPRQDGNVNDPVFPGGESGPPGTCVSVGQHCDHDSGGFFCCSDGTEGMFISVPSIHYYIDSNLSLPVLFCNANNVCAIDPISGDT